MVFSIKLLFIALIVGWVIQIPFNHMQVSNIRKTFSQLGKEGKLITGAQKDLLRGSCIVAIVVNNNKVIKKMMYMKGYTVFARFRDFKKFDGKTITEVLEICPKSSKSPLYRAIRKSLTTALKQVSTKSSTTNKKGDIHV